jgi:hypothetical protein
MKQILSALLLFVGLTSTQAEIIPQVANINARQVTSLNGEWHYIVDVQEEGYYDRKGLYSDKGEKKKAFYVLQQWYKGK